MEEINNGQMATEINGSDGNTNHPAIQPSTSHYSLPTKTNSFLVSLLSILLLLAVSAAGFFAYQTQKLVDELRIMNDELSQTQPTTSGVPTGTATPDPTADWETYTNIEKGYSVKYPKNGFLRLICPGEELTATNDGIGEQKSPVEMSTCARGGKYTLETKTYESIQTEPSQIKNYIIEIKNITLDNLPAAQYIYTLNGTPEGPFPEWYSITRVNKNNKTYEIWFDEKDDISTLDQILSTFKFIETQASSSPVACTMEAKVCPDGSSVGRIGPNCEFAPCPN